MYDWNEQIEREARAQRKRWNGRVITTGRQWSCNADGAIEPMESSLSKIWEAVQDYRNSRSWE